MNTEMKTANQVRRLMALIAGWSLIAMAIVAGGGYGYAFETLYVAGDAAATFRQWQQYPELLLGVVGAFSVILVLDVVVAWALNRYFEDVHPELTLAMSWARLSYAVALGGALFKLLPLFQLTTPPEAATVMTHFIAFLKVWSLGLIVFGLHLVLVGMLIFRSNDMPRWLWVMVVLAGVFYSTTHLAQWLFPAYEPYRELVDKILAGPMALGELSLAVWLIVKGGKG